MVCFRPTTYSGIEKKVSLKEIITKMVPKYTHKSQISNTRKVLLTPKSHD